MKSGAQLSIICLLLLTVSHASAAQTSGSYPERPIRLIVPFPPGGSYDVISRILSYRLSERLSQQVVVDNRPGAGGVLGAQLIAKANSDGYTIGMIGNPQTIAVNVNPSVGFDMVSDFTPLSSVAALSNVVAVNPSVPVRSMKELIDLAKSKPGVLNYGSGGIGATSHLAGELLKSSANINLVHIPYNGAARALVDLIAGRIQIMVVNMVIALPNVNSGKLRALAVASPVRSTYLPDIPSAKESGLPGFEFSQWYGVVAPAGTPNNIANILSKELSTYAGSDHFKGLLEKQGAEPFVLERMPYAQFIKDDVQMYKLIVKNAGIK